MVGSVLMDRMHAEGDFALIEPLFFSTSNAGGKAPAQAKNETVLRTRTTSNGPQALRDRRHRQGGDYTKKVYPKRCAPRAGRVTGSTPRRRCA